MSTAPAGQVTLAGMRIATFNLESFGQDPFDTATLAPRFDRLRPLLERLDADVLCLQEVNAQRLEAGAPRCYAALDALLADTRYAGYYRATSDAADTPPAEKHNLVVLSRFPVRHARAIRYDYVTPPHWRRRLAEPSEADEHAVEFDRPILAVSLDLPDGRPLQVFTVHLRAPIAAPVPGQKLSATCWKSVPGWAEGYFIAAMKRTGQALELRHAIDAVFDEEPDARIAAVGDFNAVEVESALRIVIADAEDTGNPELAGRALIPAEDRVPEPRRYTVRHHDRPIMLDHILLSRSLASRLEGVEILNRDLADEIDDAGTEAELGSFHAPMVAAFRE